MLDFQNLWKFYDDAVLYSMKYIWCAYVMWLNIVLIYSWENVVCIWYIIRCADSADLETKKFCQTFRTLRIKFKLVYALGVLLDDNASMKM